MSSGDNWVSKGYSKWIEEVFNKFFNETLNHTAQSVGKSHVVTALGNVQRKWHCRQMRN